MRVFIFAAAALVLLGSSAALGVEARQSVDPAMAFQRLTLEAELESFYAALERQAAGLSEAERRALYAEAETRLTAMIVASPVYGGLKLRKGLTHLDQARAQLAWRIGLAEGAS